MNTAKVWIRARLTEGKAVAAAGSKSAALKDATGTSTGHLMLIRSLMPPNNDPADRNLTESRIEEIIPDDHQIICGLGWAIIRTSAR